MNDRVEFIDVLRGFALFGVCVANLFVFSGLTLMPDEARDAAFTGLDRSVWWLEHFFIENKFVGLFSLLFGISFWLFLSRVAERGLPAVTMFHRRIAWLFAIGAVHGWLFWCFDILRFYALWAIVLPFFVRTRHHRLLVLGVLTSVLAPAAVAAAVAWSIPSSGSGVASVDYEALALSAFSMGSYRDVLRANWRYDWYLNLDPSQLAYQVAVFGRLLLGLGVARALDLQDLAPYRRLLRWTLIAGASIGIAGNLVFASGLAPVLPGHVAWAFGRRAIVEAGYLGLTLAWAAALALAWQVPAAQRGLRRLAPIGRMALTWYLLQTAFGLWLFYGFAPGPAAMGRLGAAAVAGWAVAWFLTQIVVAGAWMRRFRFGPAEWAWRELTYGRMNR